MKIATGICLGLLVGSVISSSLTIYQQHKQLELLSTSHASRVEQYEDRLKVAHNNTVNELSLKNTEIEELNLALDTAFKEYELVKTLLDKDVKEWTATTVLETEAKLTSLPSGSWFKDGHYVTAPFGSKLLSGTFWGSRGHRGVDIKPNSGNNREPIISVMDGRVVTWGRNDRLFGNYLVIESLDGMFQIKLAHLSTIAIYLKDGTVDLFEGQQFTKGTQIATMGATGRVTGTHLHAEYYIFENDNWRLLNASAIIEHIGAGDNEGE